jgi:hypothetical protein
VRGAVEAVTGISGNAGAAFAAWQTQAEKRALLDQSLRGLNVRLLETAVASGSAG